MPEPEGSTTCTLCNRAIYVKDVNSSGRCVDCAGKRSDDDEEDSDETARRSPRS